VTSSDDGVFFHSKPHRCAFVRVAGLGEWLQRHQTRRVVTCVVLRDGEVIPKPGEVSR
jgi:hypothetical protein